LPALSRGLARNLQRLPKTGETVIHAAMSRIMLRRMIRLSGSLEQIPIRLNRLIG
jgi:hypothetical protein